MKNGDLARFYDSDKKPTSSTDRFVRRSDLTDFIGEGKLVNPETVTVTNELIIIEYEDGSKLELPIIGARGISVDKAEEGQLVEIRSDPHMLYDYEITGVPVSSTNGSIPADEVLSLQNATHATITFNNEMFYKGDNQHTVGTLVFFHLGYEGGEFVAKTITITISTNTWVLTSTFLQTKSE